MTKHWKPELAQNGLAARSESIRHKEITWNDLDYRS